MITVSINVWCWAWGISYQPLWGQSVCIELGPLQVLVGIGKGLRK